MKNRLFIYQEGITQIKWGLVETYVCRDITEIHLERATRYASGVAYNVRYHCTLRRNDGSRAMLDAVRLTASVAKAICENAPIAILHGEKDIVVDRHWH